MGRVGPAATEQNDNRWPPLYQEDSSIILFRMSGGVIKDLSRKIDESIGRIFLILENSLFYICSINKARIVSTLIVLSLASCAALV